MTKILLFYITTPSQDAAETLAKEAIEKNLAACANILPNMQSLYMWENSLEQNSEVVLLLKTSHTQQKALTDLITKIHPYECPCIMSLPIDNVNEAYKNWLLKSLAK